MSVFAWGFGVVVDDDDDGGAVIGTVEALSAFRFLRTPLLRCFEASPASLLAVAELVDAVARALLFLGAFAGADDSSLFVAV